ncbi:hypothetical protein JCM19992_15150 [Thermostilla marina]
MPVDDRTFYNLKTLHWWFLAGGMLTLGVTVWLGLRDADRPWRRLQRQQREAVEPWLEAARTAAANPAQSPPESFVVAEHRRGPILAGFDCNTTVRELLVRDIPVEIGGAMMPRVDRCTTCHAGIEENAAGLPHNPLVAGKTVVTLRLPLPFLGETDETDIRKPEELDKALGWCLVDRDVTGARRPTVLSIQPKSPAACAGLHIGDVITHMADRPVTDSTEAKTVLLELLEDARSHTDDARSASDEAALVQVGYPSEFFPDRFVPAVVLTVERGTDSPLAAHPRLDLFVAEDSPHPASRFGCTVCHDGRPWATDFVHAGHTIVRDDGSVDASIGEREWSQPMLPEPLLESRCIRCHYEVFDLADHAFRASSTAPRAVEGYRLVRRLGCFGCHEISGYRDGCRTGPDLRSKPPSVEAAESLLAEFSLPEDLASRLRAVADGTVTSVAPEQIVEGLEQVREATPLEDPIARARWAELLRLLRDVPAHPGTLRKIGPSLRHVGEKLSKESITKIVADPRAVRPDAKMPRLFGIDSHLSRSLRSSTEPIEQAEIACIAEYLVWKSRPFSNAIASEVNTDGNYEPASITRGKELFETQGCLACHTHRDYSGIGGTIGPDLSDLARRIGRGTNARRWLEAWLREPASYSTGTKMPAVEVQYSPLSTPSAYQDGIVAAGDPIRDLAGYLLSGENPEATAETSLTSIAEEIDRLFREFAGTRLSNEELETCAERGLSAERAAVLGTGWEALIGGASLSSKARFVGYQAIARRGCFGCHTISGFEGAAPIGPPLSDFGRKPVELLAFERIERYLAETDVGRKQSESDGERPYLALVKNRRREGFLYQKLTAPRSFDYQIAETKRYGEFLRMGQFSLSLEDREAIMTFVLGLTQDAPGEAWSPYAESGRDSDAAYFRSIRARARPVMEEYGCDACHLLRPEEWTFRYAPEMWYPPVPRETYSSLLPQFTAAERKASKLRDLAGFQSATVRGLPQYDMEGNLLEDLDEFDQPLYFFTLLEPAVIDGEVWAVGGAQLAISKPQLTARREAWGGRFARQLHSVLLQRLMQMGAAMGEAEAWGLGPPPLIHEGEAVRADWLDDYLASPTVVRPSCALRMPRFSLSDRDRQTLVRYFETVAEARQRRRIHGSIDIDTLLPQFTDESTRTAAWEKAQLLLTDTTTYCGKCHAIGSRLPPDETGLVVAPRLDRVRDRLKKEHLVRWVADPKSVLPYTSMPVNFPPDGEPLDRRLFDADSREQMAAVIDLLLHYGEFLLERTLSSDSESESETLRP